MKRMRRPLLFILVCSVLLCLVRIPAWAQDLEGAGTELNPFQISNETQLRMIADFSDACWILTNDVELTSRWTPVAEFTGTLDGNGYRISGLELYDEEGYWPNESAFIKVNQGTIRNLHVSGTATFQSSHLGGAILVYQNEGTIENCSLKGSLHLILSSQYSTNNSECGGMVSHNTESGVIENCYTRLSVTGQAGTADRSKLYHTSLFVNDNDGLVRNCYSASQSTSATDTYEGFSASSRNTDCYESCYYDKDLPGIAASELDESFHKYPRTTAAMKMQYNYTGWDFTQTWAMDESINDGYPYLQNERSVTVRVTGLALDRTEATVQEGSTVTLRPVFTPENASNQTVSWSTSSRYVATVQDGVVTGVSEGKATITATSEDGGFTAQCVVTVTPEPVTPQDPGGACGEDLTWTLKDGTLSISGAGPMAFDGYEAPWMAYAEEITKIELGNGVTTLADYAFSYTNIREITIPASVTEIGTEALGSCTALETISVAAGNPAYSAQDGVLFDKDKGTLLQYPSGKTDVVYHVPEGVKTIAYSAFYLNDALKDLYIPDTVTTIEEYGISTFSTLTVHGTAGGAAEAYVEQHNQGSSFPLLFVPVVSGTYDYTVNSVWGVPSDSGKFRATVSVTKNTDVEGGVIILAMYSREGAFLDYIFMQGDFEQGKTYTFGGTLTGSEGAVLKAFVWRDLETMVPISNAMSGGAG